MQTIDENQVNDYLFAAAQGDKEDYGILYNHYLDEIYRFVFIKVGNKMTAEDITEETFIRVWENLPRIYKNNGKIDNFRAFLYRTANNLVIDFYRKRKTLDKLETNKPDKPPSTEELVTNQEQYQILANHIKRLRPDYQQVIILRLINNLSHREVASIMNISEGHSRILLYRALKKLRKIIT